MPGSTELVDELAGLARLELPEAEAEALAAQLEQILAYLRTLAEAPIEGVPEYELEGEGSGLRDDRVGPMLDTDAALADAPDRRGPLVAVPKFKD